MNYIVLNGVNSNTINGLLISTLPAITKPPIRVQIEEIDGKDGDIITPLGYAAYDKTFQIGLYGDYEIDEVIKFFDSSGTVTFSNEDDKFYYYKIIERIDFERLIRFKTATVTMHVQPFKYSLLDQYKTFIMHPQLLNFTSYNNTINGITVNVTANGAITVSGTGTSATEFYIPIPAITLTAGNYTLNAYSSGTSPNNCSIRLIKDSPSAANSFGGAYVTLINGETVSINANLIGSNTYNYIYFYITPGTINFNLNLVLLNNENSDLTIRNNGNTTAKPTITIYGGGTINLSVNGVQIFVIQLGNLDNITIDTNEMEAYSGGELRNRLITGDYENFVLNPGKNDISVSGEVRQIKIENFSRWI